ncbi:MAG: pentapeptide repeat-containing protein [Aphanizomenon sp.]
MLVIAFSVFSGFLFLNPSPSYAYIRDLSGARLSGANLSGADLIRADLSGADLSRARLSRAIADSETIFPDGFDAVEEGVRFQN